MTVSNGLALGKRICKGVMLALVLTLAMSGVAEAQQVIEDLDDPIRLELKTPIDGPGVREGQPFSAVMTEELFYADEGWKLPAGTVFNGHVVKSKESRRFNRPAYVILGVDEARMPDGTVFSFGERKYGVRKKKVNNPSAETFGINFVQQLPFTFTSAGTSIPLRTATDLPGGVVTAISLGARMVTGAVLGMTEHREGRSLPKAAAVGAFEGTSIPRAYQFLFKKDEALSLQSGQEIKLHLDPVALADLFKTRNTIVQGY